MPYSVLPLCIFLINYTRSGLDVEGIVTMCHLIPRKVSVCCMQFTCIVDGFIIMMFLVYVLVDACTTYMHNMQIPVMHDTCCQHYIFFIRFLEINIDLIMFT